MPRRPLPLAQAADFVQMGDKYVLSGKHYLALRGSITDNPTEGAQQYNQELINNHLIVKNPKPNVAVKFQSNRRVTKINRLLESDEPIKVKELSKIELVILTELFYN
jgi:hypothetical protein